MILRAAGDLGNDRQAWQLYQQWRALHALPDSHFYGGVALFNLRRSAQAAQTWRRIRDRSWEFAALYAEVAELFEAGLLPPLMLPYATPRQERFAEAKEGIEEPGGIRRFVERIVADPPNLMLLLHALFVAGLAAPEASHTSILSDLVAFGGQWGNALAHAVFGTNRLPDAWKMAAAEGLMKAGALDPDEPVAMLIGGTLRQVTVKRVPFALDTDPELESRRREALTLWERGEVEQARRILEEMVHGQAQVYGPVVMTYAMLLAHLDEWAEARRWLEMLHGAVPDHPGVLFYLAQASARDGDVETARRHLAAIEIDDLPPELADQVAQLAADIEHPHLLDARAVARMSAQLAEDYRLNEEERRISPDRLTLLRALTRLPAEWVDAACDLYGIPEPARLKRDRVGQLHAHIVGHPAAVPEALRRIDGRARQLLAFMLAQGGVVKKGEITKQFGPDRGDGFWWRSDPPHSPLGRLRLASLVFVGRTTIYDRGYKVAVVPADVRPLLAEALG